jgi:hypothetical protein
VAGPQHTRTRDHPRLPGGRRQPLTGRGAVPRPPSPCVHAHTGGEEHPRAARWRSFPRSVVRAASGVAAGVLVTVSAAACVAVRTLLRPGPAPPPRPAGALLGRRCGLEGGRPIPLLAVQWVGRQRQRDVAAPHQLPLQRCAERPERAPRQQHHLGAVVQRGQVNLLWGVIAAGRAVRHDDHSRSTAARSGQQGRIARRA